MGAGLFLALGKAEDMVLGKAEDMALGKAKDMGEVGKAEDMGEGSVSSPLLVHSSIRIPPPLRFTSLKACERGIV